MQRKAKNGVDDKHYRMEGNAIRRPRETGSKSGAMESHIPLFYEFCIEKFTILFKTFLIRRVTIGV